MRVLFALAVASLAYAAPASAQSRSDCPVASDLGKGIRLTRQAPLFDMVLRKAGKTVTVDRTTEQRGKRRRIKTTYLNGLIPLVRKEGNSVISARVGNKNTNFVSGGQVRNWSSSVDVRIDGKPFGTGRITLRKAGNATWTGNGCSYKVKRVIVKTQITGMPASHYEYYYAPALGISLGGYALGPDGRTRRSGILPERISRK